MPKKKADQKQPDSAKKDGGRRIPIRTAEAPSAAEDAAAAAASGTEQASSSHPGQEPETDEAREIPLGGLFKGLLDLAQTLGQDVENVLEKSADKSLDMASAGKEKIGRKIREIKTGLQELKKNLNWAKDGAEDETRESAPEAEAAPEKPERPRIVELLDEIEEAFEEGDVLQVFTLLAELANEIAEFARLYSQPIAELGRVYGKSLEPAVREILGLVADLLDYFYTAAAEINGRVEEGYRKYSLSRAKLLKIEVDTLEEAGFNHDEAFTLVLARASKPSGNVSVPDISFSVK